MSPSPSNDPEEFWADLIPLVAARQVVPIVGSDLLTVTVDGVERPFYQIVAERLLKRYGIDAAAANVTLRPRHELNDAVCALDRLGKRASADSYLPVFEAIRGTLDEHRHAVSVPLRQLAAIDDLRLFVTTSVDDALAQAIDAVRYQGQPRTEQVEYAPDGLPNDRVTDIEEGESEARTAVLYLFGKAAVSPVFATHDEDILEFLHGIQAGLGRMPARFFSEIRSANLLLIGCHFPDWLSRFLVRVAASKRLSEQPRRKDFVIDPSHDEPEFVVFLTTFARNTRISALTPSAFVAEFLSRWKATRPQVAPGPAAPAVMVTPQGRKPAVFISYSRSDLGPARALFDELQRLAGNDVAWFDKSVLEPGNEWEQRILDGINNCQLFLPVVSTTEEQRTEGFFIAEWRAALERARSIDGRAFIVPIFIDTDAEKNLAQYPRAQRMFGHLDYGFAPGGKLTPPLETALVRALRAFRG
ncbi:MAG: toll/interleukin-1 receptor domain-containing protein [Acidobacteria bacterium]|nr:toll/interleukin-1 receptor domain-containing protein [Acidobacteriota bacterium]